MSARRLTCLFAPVLGVAVIVLLHLAQPATDPVRWPLSDYALGHDGWLLAVAFLLFAGGELALAAELRRRVGSRAGAVLLILSAVGFVAVAVFQVPSPGTAAAVAHVQGSAHGLSAQLAFFGVTAAMLVLAPRLGRIGMRPGVTRALAVASIVVAAVGWRQPPAVQGAWERIYLALLLGWLVRAGIAVLVTRRPLPSHARRPAAAV